VIRDAELKLLVVLCAAAIRGEALAPGGEYEWSRLIELARRHRVQGLAWLGLTGGAESALPEATMLLEESKSIAHHNLLAVAAAARLKDEFDKRGLALLFLKGLTLGALAYPNTMLKMSADVDVLVDPAQIEPAEECLLSLGYRPEGERRTESKRAAAAKEWPWAGSDGLAIDLHTRLADNPALLPAISARSPTQDVEVSPGISLPTLRDEELFAYLSVHGASSAWFRLKWVTDFAAFLARRPADDVRQLYRASEAFGAGRCPDVALLLAEALFGPLVPEDAIASAKHDPIARLLAGLSKRELVQVREPLERPLGTAAIHFTQLFMGRGVRFPLREFGRQVSNVIA
jgi:hypothetical protein